MPARKPKGPVIRRGRPPVEPDPALLKGPNLFPRILDLKKRAFLIAFAYCGRLLRSAQRAHIDPRYHWIWLEQDPVYAEEFARAGKLAADIIENQMLDLAIEGYKEGVWWQGIEVGSRQRYLPTLLLAAVNAAKPDKYLYRQETKHTVSDNLMALQQQWTALREANVSPNALPEGREVIDVTPYAGEAEPPARTERIFEMLDAVNRWSREREDDEADIDA